MVLWSRCSYLSLSLMGITDLSSREGFREGRRHVVRSGILLKTRDKLLRVFVHEQFHLIA